MFSSQKTVSLRGNHSPAADKWVRRHRQPGCMVVGESPSRRRLLGAAAESAGWNALPNEDAALARVQLLRQPQPLVIVDLENESGTAAEPLKQLAERTSRQKDTLLVLCGNEGNPGEEIWARQLGVWLYLPGVVDHSDLASLFAVAGLIAERRQVGVERQAYFPGRRVATA